MDSWLRIFGTLQPDGTYLLSSGDNSLVTSILSAGTFCGTPPPASLREVTVAGLVRRA